MAFLVVTIRKELVKVDRLVLARVAEMIRSHLGDDCDIDEVYVPSPKLCEGALISGLSIQCRETGRHYHVVGMKPEDD